MKHARVLLLALCMTSSFAATAQVDSKVQRCEAKLHACFKTGDITAIFTPNPIDLLECRAKCDTIEVSNACSKEECADRCAVTYGIVPPPCE